MGPTLDAIKGGRGSVRIGATGTISSLMSRELLDSVKLSPQSTKSSLRRSPTIPVDVPCVSRLRRQPTRTVMNEASTSGSSTNHGGPGSTRKKAQSFPMLGSDDSDVDSSSHGEKPDKKGSYIVEVVDLKCGSHEKAWSKPITHQLRKLSFSRLSESTS